MSKTPNFSMLAFVFMLAGFSFPAMAQSQNPKLDKRVQNIFEVAMKSVCESLDPDIAMGEPKPEIYQLSFNYGNEDYPPRPFRLYIFPCTMGAYNFGSVFYGADDYDEIRQIQFAMPDFDVTYKSDEPEADVSKITTGGFYAYQILIGAYFDPETKTITSFSKWRGLADASSSGQWVFKDGNFVLESYDVDASYDGKINPVRIYGEGKAPQGY